MITTYLSALMLTTAGLDGAAAADFDRPALLQLAPADVQADIAASGRHILVVRHAYKISPDCNGMECPLSEAGEAMVTRHSNTSCLWLAEFAGVAAAETAGCEEGRLPETAYGDIYWLYQSGGDWQLTVLPGAFSVEAE